MKNRLKVFRAMHDLTQEDLAEKLGVTRQTINAIEKQRYNPSLELAFKLADFFGVTIEELFIYQHLEHSQNQNRLDIKES